MYGIKHKFFTTQRIGLLDVIYAICYITFNPNNYLSSLSPSLFFFNPDARQKHYYPRLYTNK